MLVNGYLSGSVKGLSEFGDITALIKGFPKKNWGSESLLHVHLKINNKNVYKKYGR